MVSSFSSLLFVTEADPFVRDPAAGDAIVTIELHPVPMTVGRKPAVDFSFSPGAIGPPCFAAGVCTVTFVPLGGVKSNNDAAGLVKSIDVNPTETASAFWPRASMATFSGRPVSASTDRVTCETNVPLDFGVSSSW